MTLDLYTLCSEANKKALEKGRSILAGRRDEEVEKRRKAKQGAGASSSTEREGERGGWGVGGWGARYKQQRTRAAQARATEWGSVCGGWPGQRVEEQGTWASRTPKRSEAGCGRPEDGGVWTAQTVKRPPRQPPQPPIRQLLGAADAQTAHPATSSTAPAHLPLGSVNAETTPPSSDRALLGLSANEQFSTAPSAQVYLGQNYSSAPIKTQGHCGGVDGKTVKRPRQQCPIPFICCFLSRCINCNVVIPAHNVLRRPSLFFCTLPQLLFLVM